MALENIALVCVLVLAGIWVVVMLATSIAMFPFGLPILGVILIVGFFFYRVVVDRLRNKEDDYYEKNVKQ